MTQFRDRTLGVASLCEIARHVELCASCHQRYREVFQEKRGPGAAWFGFSSDNWLKEEHLDGERMVAFADGRAEAEDCEIIEEHLRICGPCRSDVERLRAHRREEGEKGAGWRRWIGLPKSQAAGGPWAGWVIPALAVLLFLLLLGAIRWGGRGRTEAPRTGDAAVAPAPPPEEKREAPEPSRPPEVRRDRPASVEAARAGVRRVRSEGRLERPPILDDLMMEPGMTRSDPRGDTEFRLVSPPQEVIPESRPTFRWDGLRGATGYKVSVASPSDWKAVESPALDGATRSWTPPSPMRRGETYTWVVQALTPDGGVRIPSTAEPERRFKILNARDYQRLLELRRQNPPRLARAILYAQMGLLGDAEADLLLLPREGPDAALISRLLVQIRAWRQLRP
ncbi:MAG: zf-HC2 domain-containing protein [Blastocatellia bacterium]